MKNVLKPLAKNVLINLGLMAAEVAIQNRFFGLGMALTISNEEMDYIMKIV